MTNWHQTFGILNREYKFHWHLSWDCQHKQTFWGRLNNIFTKKPLSSIPNIGVKNIETSKSKSRPRGTSDRRRRSQNGFYTPMSLIMPSVDEFIMSWTNTALPYVMHHLGNWTLRLLGSSPTGHFKYWSFHLRDISPNRHFAYWTVRLLDISLTAWTVHP